MDVYCSSSLGPIVFLTFEAIYELGWTIASLNQVTISIHICGWLCLVTTPFGAAGSLPIRSAMAMKKKENQFTGLHRISWVCLKIACSKISGYYYMFLYWNCQKIGVFALLDKPKDGWLSAAKGYATCNQNHRMDERMDQGRNLFLFFLIWLVGGLHSFAWLMVYLGLWLPKIPK